MTNDEFFEEFESIVAWYGYDDMVDQDDAFRLSHSIAALVEQYVSEHV